MGRRCVPGPEGAAGVCADFVTPTLCWGGRVYPDGPHITAVTPAAGGTADGTHVTIDGNGFSGWTG